MNRIDQRFAELSRADRAALIPYVTAGHPSPQVTVPVLHALVEAGADLLELGVPFSDVMADGPVIQNACKRALDQGTDTDRVLELVAEFRRSDPRTPLILMGYMNPLERRGLERFARQAARAGADGILVVDCPADEAGELRETLAGHGLHQIFLAAPTTTDARLGRTAAMAAGFIYYVSLKGVTGAATLDAGKVRPAIERIRRHSSLPVAVGFGIGTPDQAAEVARIADGVVIGSALVDRLDGCDDPVATARAFLAPVREAMDNARRTPKSDQVANA